MVGFSHFKWFVYLILARKCLAKLPIYESNEELLDQDKAGIININTYRSNVIKNDFQFTWKGYKELAFGSDEIRPVDGKAVNNTWNNWGMTLVDSLDTLWMLGLKEEFKEALEVVKKKDFKRGPQVLPFYDVTVKYLGGLISAYELSGDLELLEKAKDLADLMLNNFNPASGYPYEAFDFQTKKPIRKRITSLANIGGFQMEFIKLSQLTKNVKYKELALKVYDTLELAKGGKGNYYSLADVESGEFYTRSFSFGSGANTFFSYLVKLHIMLGPKDSNSGRFLKSYEESIGKLKTKLLRTCFKGRICMGHTSHNEEFVPEMNHREFYVPGMMLLGSNYIKNKNHREIALSLLETYAIIPTLTLTGLAPETSIFYPASEIKPYNVQNSLGSELAESLFYAFRTTNSSRYQDTAWKLYLDFQKYSKSKFGFSEYRDVMSTEKGDMQLNRMPSHFYAETIKYLYLIFAPKEEHNLTDWVFNAGGHPFKVNL